MQANQSSLNNINSTQYPIISSNLNTVAEVPIIEQEINQDNDEEGNLIDNDNGHNDNDEIDLVD